MGVRAAAGGGRGYLAGEDVGGIVIVKALLLLLLLFLLVLPPLRSIIEMSRECVPALGRTRIKNATSTRASTTAKATYNEK